MTSRRHRAGKEVAEERSGPDEDLPPRLFATDRYPSRRLNVYSSVDYLLLVRDALSGKPEMEKLLNSCFGKLFRLPARRCYSSGKLCHTMLTRQLVTRRRHELWPVFGGNPFRFSLVEFGAVTGLPCGPFEEGYSNEYQSPVSDENYAYWEKLIGEDRDITIPEIADMVLRDKKMAGWRRLKLCLLIIVDGVLVATTQNPKPTLKYVKRLESLKGFLSFPWGRESFLWTISTMQPGPKVLDKCEDPVGDFCQKMRQQTVKMVGFPVALQLVAFELVPALAQRLGGDEETTLFDFPGAKLPQHAGLTLADVLQVEFDPKLLVQPMMEVAEPDVEGWGLWDTVMVDRKVEHMLKLIEDGHVFCKAEWGGGDSGEVLYVHGRNQKKSKRKSKAMVGGVVESRPLKQRRVSGYFRRGIEEDKVAWLGCYGCYWRGGSNVLCILKNVKANV